MTLSRRRFLAICAATGLAGAPAKAAAEWRGRAFGADAAITLRGADPALSAAALAEAEAMIRHMERQFSLHDPASALSLLNRTGRLDRPSAAFIALLELCSAIHRDTGGIFDPTVQPLWQLLAAAAPQAPEPADLAAALELVGWHRVTSTDRGVRLGRAGMALTFNGVAQGFATDRVCDVLRAHGFTEILVDMGEMRAGQGAWRIGVEDPAFGLVATRTLTEAAIATSSPGALRFGSGGPSHILDATHAAARPVWATVSVTAATAAVADAVSTAACFMSRRDIAALRAARDDIAAVLLVDTQGDLRTV